MSTQSGAGSAHSNMFDAAIEGTFMGMYCQGEDILQSDPNTKHVVAALSSMECVVVHDLFLNETANYAHVFLPGSTFLEKDGTFTNAERRIQRVRKVMAPLNGFGDWEITQKLANAMGYAMNYEHPSQIMDEIAALTPTFTRRPPMRKLEDMGSVQWPCNEKAPKARRSCISITSCAERASSSLPNTSPPTSARARASRCCSPRAASSASTMSARRHAAPTTWSGIRKIDSKCIRTTPSSAACANGDWVRLASRAGETTLRALITERVAPGVVYTTFHHPDTQANVITDRVFRLGDQLSGIQGDGGADFTVEWTERLAEGI